MATLVATRTINGILSSRVLINKANMMVRYVITYQGDYHQKVLHSVPLSRHARLKGRGNENEQELQFSTLALQLSLYDHYLTATNSQSSSILLPRFENGRNGLLRPEAGTSKDIPTVDQAKRKRQGSWPLGSSFQPPCDCYPPR